VKVDNDTRGQVTQLCDIFRAHIVDAGPDTVIVEVTGDEDKITSMTELLRPIGILEMVRTGVVTMARGDQVLAPPDLYFATNGNRSNGFRQNVL